MEDIKFGKFLKKSPLVEDATINNNGYEGIFVYAPKDKTHSKDEILEQINSFISNILTDKEYIMNDIELDCKYNWLGENDNIRYKILASKDYEITLKTKGL